MKINWSQALVDYLTDESITYDTLAKKYGVSKRAIVTRAKQDKWQDLRTVTSLKVHQKLPEIVGANLAEIASKQAEIGNKLIERGLEAITRGSTPKTPQDARLFIQTGIEVQRKALGLDEQKFNPSTIIVMSKEIQEWAT